MLSGECSGGVAAGERAHAVTLLSGLGAALPLRADVHKDAGEHDAARWRESQRAARVFGTASAAGPREAVADEEWWLAARFVSGMPPELGPGARARILAKAEEEERAAPAKKRVGLVKARAAALRAAREVVLGVLEELAFHLAVVVGRWRERLTGREVETARTRRRVWAEPARHTAAAPATPRRAPKRTAAEVEEELPEVQSQEQAADSMVDSRVEEERLAGRAEPPRGALIKRMSNYGGAGRGRGGGGRGAGEATKGNEQGMLVTWFCCANIIHQHTGHRA